MIDCEDINGPVDFMEKYSHGVEKCNKAVADAAWDYHHPAFPLEMDPDVSEIGVREDFAKAIREGKYDEVDLFGTRILVLQEESDAVAALLNIGALAVIEKNQVKFSNV